MRSVIEIVPFVFILASCAAILTGYEQPNGSITDDKKYGCVWQGGTSAGVKCTCTEDAEEMFIGEMSISSFETSIIEITNCKNVRFGANAITHIGNLRKLNLNNIGSLELQDSSLKWYGYRDKSHYEERYDLITPSLSISITNSTISQIGAYTFEGRFNTIYLKDLVIESMQPFAFTGLLQTHQIAFENVQLHNIKEQTFKKFATENFQLDGVRGALIPSRFLNNVTVYKSFRITRCSFETVRPGGFIVTNPVEFQVLDTKIRQLDGEAFKVYTRGDVLFKNNSFAIVNDGAFAGITLNVEGPILAGLTLDSNTFTTLTRDSLNTNENFHLKLTNLNLNESCDCTSIDHKLRDVQFYSEIKCLINEEFVTVEEFKSNMCSIVESYATVFVIVGVVITLAVIIGTVLIVYYRRVYLSKKYGNEKNTKKGNMSLIVPDGRTYRETELHVIVERADLLTTDL